MPVHRAEVLTSRVKKQALSSKLSLAVMSEIIRACAFNSMHLKALEVMKCFCNSDPVVPISEEK